MPKVKSSKKQGKDIPDVVPYVYGFRLATKRKQIHALGYLRESEVPIELHFHGFDPIKPCTSVDDWLAQHNEPAQSYSDFLAQCPWLAQRRVTQTTQQFIASGSTLPEKYPQATIYIQPLGNFEKHQIDLLNFLVEYTEIFLGLPVDKLPTIELDITENEMYIMHTADKDGKPINDVERGRLWARFMNVDGVKHHQLCTSAELTELKRYLPQDGLFMVVLTNQDLYQQKSDLFVAGIGAGYERLAIFTLFRYNPNLVFSQTCWYDVQLRDHSTTDKSSALLLQRAARLLIHEIGHLLGFKHCVYFNCCMNGSGHLQEDFSQPLHFCPIDLRKLQTLVGFDLKKRYKGLETFYRTCGLSDEANWVTAKLEYIQNAEIVPENNQENKTSKQKSVLTCTHSNLTKS